MKILIVEDSSVSREILSKTLKENNPDNSIETLASSGEAARRLQDEKFDVILLDLGLPDTQGIATVRAIRKVSPNTPVVVLTTSDDQNTILEAIRNDVQEYLIKDETTASLLLRTICSAIERKKVEVEKEREIQNLKMHNQVLLNRNLGLF
ncbi:MAG: response regulator transcription factor [Candidatus Omnitrophica bacterium]|nr:response regulator transcription factor [Candidatus Omnitrophota bacterium]